jgi:hypothetical protein
LNLNFKNFLVYKFLNSLFLGLSIGAIFTIYVPLKPIVYSIGGIALALGLMFVAFFYEKILNIKSFFIISLVVEVVMALTIVTFLVFSYSYAIALVVYVAYQFTFIFGSYLVRVETLILKTDNLLKKVDISKQSGYLVGLLGSFAFYKLVENIDKGAQVYNLHFILLALQVTIILSLVKSFSTHYPLTTSH